jgi:hypothetical protein
MEEVERRVLKLVRKVFRLHRLDWSESSILQNEEDVSLHTYNCQVGFESSLRKCGQDASLRDWRYKGWHYCLVRVLCVAQEAGIRGSQVWGLRKLKQSALIYISAESCLIYPLECFLESNYISLNFQEKIFQKLGTIEYTRDFNDVIVCVERQNRSRRCCQIGLSNHSLFRRMYLRT